MIKYIYIYIYIVDVIFTLPYSIYSLFTESFTPDHKPLMGESPEVRGYFLGCGFNSSGMMLS